MSTKNLVLEEYEEQHGDLDVVLKKYKNCLINQQILKVKFCISEV